MERVETRKARAFEDDGARETVHGWMGRPVELRHDKARDASASDATTGQADEDDRTLRTTTEPDPNRIEAICRGEEEDLEAMACANLYLSWMARDGEEAPDPRRGPGGALARRVSARLPAFDARFTHAEPRPGSETSPTARGRKDAAIGWVRKEIKHTIQNKLHRACGPEDLVASAKMLSKLTAEDADYPQRVVDEFRTFTATEGFLRGLRLRDVLDAWVRHVLDAISDR
eukprot:jgi/Pico_ML_1/50965/g2079.t1